MEQKKVEKVDLNKVSDLDKVFEVEKKVKEDSRFGVMNIMKSKKFDHKLIMVESIINKEQLAIEKVYKLREKLNFNNDFILKLVDYSSKIDKGFCSTNYLFKTYYEEYKFDLTRLIENYKKNSKEFNHDELMDLMYDLIFSNSFLQENNKYHGDIRPDNIVKANKEYKLIDRTEDPSFQDISSIQKKNIFLNKELYLSPKFFQNMKKPGDYNKSKEDVFAVGLLLLSLATNSETKNLYNLKKNEFDNDKFNELREQLKNKFNKEEYKLFYSYVEQMLKLNEEERPDFIQLKERLPAYDQMKNNLVLNNDLNLEEENLNVQNNFEVIDENIQVNSNFNPNLNNNVYSSNVKNYQSNPFLNQENFILNGIQYFWDNQYNRHYYFDERTKDYEWNYTPEEIEQIKRMNVELNPN